MAQGRRTRLSSFAYKQARIVQRVSMPRPRASLGGTVGLRAWEVRAGGGVVPGCGQVQRGARASPPAGGAREAQSGVSIPGTHLQHRTGKCAVRWVVPCAELPRLEWPRASLRLRKPGFPEQPEGGGEFSPPSKACRVPPGSQSWAKDTARSIGSAVSVGIPFAPDLQDWPRAQGRCPQPESWFP